MQRNAEKCREMQRNEEKCREMQRIAYMQRYPHGLRHEGHKDISAYMHFSAFLYISLHLFISLHFSAFLCIFLHFSVILYISQHAFPSYVICLCTIPVTRVLIGGVGPPLYSPMHNAGRGLGSRNGMYRCRYYNVLCYQNGKIRIITRDDQPTDSRLLVVGKN